MARHFLAGALFLHAVWAAAVMAQPGPSPDELAREAEQSMSARPMEAVRIVRGVEGKLQGRPDLLKRLGTQAIKLQKQRLAMLTEAQVDELADAHHRILVDPAGAEDVRRAWLQGQEQALPAGDGPGRLRLARLWERWLADRRQAALLAHKALETAPQPALDLLRTWRVEDLSVLGTPVRVSRQILSQRVFEQRHFETPFRFFIDIDTSKGREPQIVTVQRPDDAKP